MYLTSICAVAVEGQEAEWPRFCPQVGCRSFVPKHRPQRGALSFFADVVVPVRVRPLFSQYRLIVRLPGR